MESKFLYARRILTFDKGNAAIPPPLSQNSSAPGSGLFAHDHLPHRVSWSSEATFLYTEYFKNSRLKISGQDGNGFLLRFCNARLFITKASRDFNNES
jgi:hypothetical protein